MAKPYVSVIIPAYNEDERLPLTLIDVDKHLQEQEYSLVEQLLLLEQLWHLLISLVLLLTALERYKELK